MQRVGRVLRPRPGKRAFVYELAARATTEMEQLAARRRGLDGHGAAHASEAREVGPSARGDTTDAIDKHGLWSSQHPATSVLRRRRAATTNAEVLS